MGSGWVDGRGEWMLQIKRERERGHQKFHTTQEKLQVSSREGRKKSLPTIKLIEETTKSEKFTPKSNLPT